jgi:probable rRNA maturation factor
VSRLPVAVAVSVEAGDWPADAEALVDRAVMAALTAANPVFAGAAELSVLLHDDASQRVLNRDWRQIDKPTNVLSFPQIAPGEPLAGLIGDISLAWETLRREADELDLPVADHLTHLVVHGTLHLLGYDHLEDGEAEAMESLETRILAGLGIADPYAGN